MTTTMPSGKSLLSGLRMLALLTICSEPACGAEPAEFSTPDTSRVEVAGIVVKRVEV
jgi:hypothetical protein